MSAGKECRHLSGRVRRSVGCLSAFGEKCRLASRLKPALMSAGRTALLAPSGKGAPTARGPGRSGEKFRAAHFSEERPGPHTSREETPALLAH